ncbi:hypothetical protein ACFLSQ_11045, partial [Bacteroidota bacterium]
IYYSKGTIMRNFVLSVIMIFVLCLISLNAGERVKILFKNGGQINGEIIDSIPGVSLKIKPDDLPEMVYKLSDIAKILNFTELIDTKGIYGLGLGAQYGVLGLGFEYHLPIGYSSVFAGIGHTIFAGVGWSIGGRLYFRDFYSSFQPRFTVLYGTNSILTTEKTNLYNLSSEKEYEIGTGINLGCGFKWMFGETNSWGIDFDIYYGVTTTLDDRIDELKKEGYVSEEDPPRIDFAFGFVFSF